MKKARKALLTLCAALLLVTMTVGVTVAYLTDDDAVVNTFTVGQVGIELDETDHDKSATSSITDCENTDHEHENRDRANGYYLYPSANYTKDPTIWFDEDCHLAYLRVVLEFENGAPVQADADMELADIFAKFDANAYWQDNTVWDYDEPKTVYETVTSVDEEGNEVTEEVAKDLIYTLTFKDYIDAGTNPLVLFEKLIVDEDLANDDLLLLNELKVNISAYAVQAEGFNSEDTDGFNIESANKAFEAAFDQW